MYSNSLSIRFPSTKLKHTVTQIKNVNSDKIKYGENGGVKNLMTIKRKIMSMNDCIKTKSSELKASNNPVF